KRVTIMFTVPMFLKLLKNNIEREIAQKGSGSKKSFELAMEASRHLPSHLVRRAIFHEIHEKLGGRLRGFVCGGAALDNDVAQFFDLIGIRIYQGYGLTETSPVIA